VDLFFSGFMLVWVLIIGSAIYVVFGGRSEAIANAKTKQAAWSVLPTIDEYWLQYPNCKASAGSKCCKCGSKSLKNWGLGSAQDSQRTISCQQCGTVLYRIETSG